MTLRTCSGMVPHHGERQPGAVGDAVQVPVLVTEGSPEIGNVRRRCRRVEQAQVHALVLQPVATRLDRIDLAGYVVIGGKHIVEQLEIELSRFGASQRRLGIPGPTLVEHHEISIDQVGPEAILERERDRFQGIATGSTLEIDDRVGLGVRVIGGENGDVQTHLGALGIRAVGRDHQIATADLALHGDGKAAIGLLEPWWRGGSRSLVGRGVSRLDGRCRRDRSRGGTGGDHGGNRRLLG